MIYFLQYCGFKHMPIIYYISIVIPLIDLIYFRLFTFNLSILYDGNMLISYLSAQLLNTFAVINSFGNFWLFGLVCMRALTACHTRMRSDVFPVQVTSFFRS